MKAENLAKLIFSPLEADVHPWQWIGALLADYKTLREKAAAAGIVNDDPEAESEMLAHVERFCNGAETLTYSSDVIYCRNCGAENPGVYEFLNCLKCGREGPETFTASAPPE